MNSINLEKLKIQKKLDVYKTMIDKKINKLKKHNIKVFKMNKTSLIKEGQICNMNSSNKSFLGNKKKDKTVFIKCSSLDNKKSKRVPNSNIRNKKRK